jgi:hypothetical protein
MFSVRNLFFYPERGEFAGHLRSFWIVAIITSLFLLGGYIDGYYCETYGLCD